MKKLAIYLSVPMITLGTCFLGFSDGAYAQSSRSDALDAFSTVVKARQSAETCKFLSTEELDELKHYAALSEIAAAKASSVEEMQGARDAALSAKPRCSSGEEQTVRSVLNEVRVAVNSGGGQQTARSRATAPAQQAPAQLEPVVRQGFAAAPSTRMPVPPPQSSTIARVNMGDPVARYGSHARAYFLERKCNYLNYDTELDFWKRLTDRYKVMVRQHGRSRVNAAQIAGEQEANGIACGSEARAAVLAGYNDLNAVSR